VNLGEILVRGGAAQRPALVDATGATVATYADLEQRSRRLAAALAATTAPGDRVGLVMTNRPELVVAYLAVLRAGRIAVPVNSASPAAAIDHELATVGAAMRLDAAAVQELEASANDDDHITAEMNADATAVLLFTSGTAGAPKAAMLTHGALLANLEQVASEPRLALTPVDVALGVLPLFHVYGLNTVLRCCSWRRSTRSKPRPQCATRV
jgi:long-chain acyl-CoA synthetase